MGWEGLDKGGGVGEERVELRYVEMISVWQDQAETMGLPDKRCNCNV